MNARDALRPALAALRTPAQRRAFAVELRQIADEQDALAEAQQRQERRPPAQRVAVRGGKGGRPSGNWIRIERRERRVGEADEVRIKLARAIYYAAGSPERLDVQLVGGVLYLVPARGDAGYTVIANIGGTWINASGARDIISLEARRYRATVEAGAIVVGAPAED